VDQVPTKVGIYQGRAVPTKVGTHQSDDQNFALSEIQ
jgi:hypothetical protein